jgi:SAM-dependent methyltransferase
MGPDERTGMTISSVRQQWEGAAPGWAKWEPTIARWIEPATTAMLAMAGIRPGARVLDLASGAGSQTLRAARAVGASGHVVASDISETMLKVVEENAGRAGLAHVTTLQGAAEDLDLENESFDAAVCRLGLMLFAEPARALRALQRALKPGGKVSVVVFTTPATNPFMAKPMQILLRHAGKAPPSPGQPGIFSLGAPGVVERLFTECGYVDIEQCTVAVPLRMTSAAQTLEMMREAFGAYRAVLSDAPEGVRASAWAEVGRLLESFQTPAGLEADAEVRVVAGTRPPR